MSFAEVNILGYQYSDSLASDNNLLFQEVLNQNAFFHSDQYKFEGIPILRPQGNKTPSFFISLLLLFVIAFVRNAFSFQFNNSYNLLDFFNKNNKRKQYETLSMPVLYYYILYFSALGFILFKYLDLKLAHILTIYYPILVLLVIILLLALFFILKIGLAYLTSWVFNEKENFYRYFQHVTLVNKYTTILLLFMSLIILMMGNVISIKFINLSIGVVVLSMILKVLYNFRISITLLRGNFFHFILYICTLEIIPILVLIKWIKNIS
ncbi:MAG TPA: DUF4271 domain-containing protein [Chitinophagaceae bacterium]|nr:DUF4271 domain-containing protein [Chitinophagaceae bacterium]